MPLLLVSNEDTTMMMDVELETRWIALAGNITDPTRKGGVVSTEVLLSFCFFRSTLSSGGFVLLVAGLAEPTGKEQKVSTP